MAWTPNVTGILDLLTEFALDPEAPISDLHVFDVMEAFFQDAFEASDPEIFEDLMLTLKSIKARVPSPIPKDPGKPSISWADPVESSLHSETSCTPAYVSPCPQVQDKPPAPDHDFLESATSRVALHASKALLDKYLAFELDLDPRDVLNHGPRLHKPAPQDYAALQPLFSWLPVDVIKHTFENTTQMCVMPATTHLFKRYKTPYPAANLRRRNEDDASDAIYSNTPAIDGGETDGQIFYGTYSHLTDVYKKKDATSQEFLRTFQDRVITRGVPNRLLVDHASNEGSKSVLDYLRNLVIGFWQSEPLQHHQKPCERRWQTVKRITNRLMDRTGCPAFLWFLALKYVCFVLNNCADPSLDWRTPLFVATGVVNDISVLLQFAFWEPVYYKLDDSSFPSDSSELRGRFVGIAEHVGHVMTFLILTDDTQRVIPRSNVRSALNPDARNSRLDPFNERPPTNKAFITEDSDGEVVMDTSDGELNDELPSTPDPLKYDADVPQNDVPFMVIILDENGEPQLDADGNLVKVTAPNPHDLQGRYFVSLPDERGYTKRYWIAELLEKHLASKESDPRLIKFKVKCDKEGTDFEEIVAYNEILQCINRETEEDEEILWKWRKIVAHEGPLNQNHPNYMGSKYNLIVEWEDGSVSPTSLSAMKETNKAECAEYAKEHNLLSTPGWKDLKKLASRSKYLVRALRQAKLKSFRMAPKYKFGFEVPNNYAHALKLDEKHGNKRWVDSVKLEMDQLIDYDAFIDKGKFCLKKIPKGYKQISTHLVFDVKHDARHKGRCVADGHKTDTPLDSVYSGVVSLRGLRQCIFLGELNDQDIWATDIGNAYLEAITKETVCIKAGEEFRSIGLEGHLLIIFKALYGLKSSGKRFHELLSACLRELGFKPSKADPNIYMREGLNRKGEEVWEYVATYVNDLCMVMCNPEEFLAKLRANPYNFKLKGSGELNFHLGCGFCRDKNGVLYMDPGRYIKKMEESYKNFFGDIPPLRFYSPLEEGDHPELDTSELLEVDDIVKFQSMIGAGQWSIAIGRMDIQTAIMTLSSFRVAPRVGHMTRIKRVYVFLFRFKDFKIRFLTDLPDLLAMIPIEYDWTDTAYDKFEEEIDPEAPKPLGKVVQLTHFFDANLMHDVLSGKSVTGIVHFANQTPTQWHSKKQSTSETATYGSEFVAGRTAFEQVIDQRNSWRYLGVPLLKSVMFGDNEAMQKSSTMPDARLHKRHNILTYHFVRSQIAMGYCSMVHLKSEFNIADIVSKNWGYNKVWNLLLKPLFHTIGDTANLYVNDDPSMLNIIPPED